MDSVSNQSGREQMTPKDCDTIVPAAKYHSSRRTPSSSPSSSFGSLYFPGDSPLNAATPLRFSGVPFSWEHSPGVPKKLQSHKKKESTKLLPLPPPATPPTSKKNNFEDILARKKASDPFFAAMVECSKDDTNEDSASNIWTGIKVTRGMSDRFGFINLYSSCKRTCAVSESLVYLPRPSRTANYGIIARRSR
ncbi:hypothetical protein HRI_001583400 [Hibiscus trionum]|uniref:Uncharacterized protein n=1 Tax=Hibiscus trionum TaxID=183268 RepID=A0A9W7HKR6_HIBTR|nr:hypothetical protein HRI_001583400 [Hibiscus trionum]